MGLTFGQVSALTASQYVTIAWVMTISIMLGIWLVPLIGKKLQGGMTKILDMVPDIVSRFSKGKNDDLNLDDVKVDEAEDDKQD